MLPNVESHDWSLTVAHWVVSVSTLHDRELASLVLTEPCPARSEKRDACLGELFLELIQAAEVASDRVFDRAVKSGVCWTLVRWAQAIPERVF